MVALNVEHVAIDTHCVGQRWTPADQEYLARLIAIVALGQARKAAIVIRELEPAAPAFSTEELCDEALIALSVQDAPASVRTGYPRYQRDGFIFEVISWVAATQEIGKSAVLKDPHISSTSQGLDGLMLEVDRHSAELKEATIFEDKCTDDPRGTFLAKVLPALQARHLNQRCAELVATATMLLTIAGFDERQASTASQRVLDPSIRRYRSAFAVATDDDSLERRQRLFGRYEELVGLKADQRIGACLITAETMRDWFDEVADSARAYIQSLKGAAHV